MDDKGGNVEMFSVCFVFPTALRPRQLQLLLIRSINNL